MDLIAGTADVSKIIVRDAKSTVHAIRLGHATHPSHVLGERMPAILTSLAGIYDVVILNAGEASAATPDVYYRIFNALGWLDEPKLE